MEIQSRIVVESKKGEDGKFIFRLDMPVGVPFGLAYDACFEFLNHISEMSRAAVEKARPVEAEAEEPTIEEVTPVLADTRVAEATSKKK